MSDLNKDTVLVFENLLDNSTLEKLQSTLSGSEFQWYWNEDTVGKDRYEQGDTPQFTHAFMKYSEVNSDWFYLVDPIIKKVEKKVLHKFNTQRIKANLLYPIGKPNVHPPHADEEKTPNNNYYSFIFYPFDCDGETVLYKEFFEDIHNKQKTLLLKNPPKQNSCLFFNSNRLHASSNPVKYTRRIILNFVVSID